jgi:hypothetical protein
MSDSVEQRLSKLEREVAILKTKVPSQPNWIAEINGICKDDPDFEEIVRMSKKLPDAEATDQDFARLESADNSSPEIESMRQLQASIEQSNLRRAAELSMAEKLKLGADLYDDGIRWLKQIIKAEQPDLSDEQVSEELDRRRAIKRRVEEAGLFRLYVEGLVIGQV